ncbi:MAG: hypothetical protein IAE90_00725 [Ignavibacteria bacterium]|nr:hypothetical protein [Ignavibacteria bacterium]
MDIREEALKEHSKKQIEKIAGWIGNDKKKFDQYLKHFLNDEYRVVQRISWVLSILAEEHPAMVTKSLPKIIKRLDDDDIHVAVKRNVIRILQFLPIPEKCEVKVLDHCLKYIADPNETVAVRCFAMTVAAKLAWQYPELKREVADTIKTAMKTTTPGLKVRSRDVLKKMDELPGS